MQTSVRLNVFSLSEVRRRGFLPKSVRMSTCPRDHQLLASNDLPGYRYYSCESCGGSWLPGAVLDRVLSDRGVGELTALQSASVGEVVCADCQTLCDSIVIRECRLDRCPTCRGVWLDAGEAQRVRHLFPEGSAVVGADRSRRKARSSLGYSGAECLVELVGDLLLLLLP